MRTTIGRLTALVTAALATTVLATVVVGTGPSLAQPNPYGPSSHRAVVALDDRGGYQVVETFERRMAREYRLGLGGTIPDGVRLPGGRSTDLPGILRPEFGPVTAVVDGNDLTVGMRRTGHAATLMADLEKAAGGDHHAEFRYGRTAATVAADTSASTYVQTFGSGTIDLTASRPITGVSCVTFAPTSEPCGRRTAAGWEVQPDDRPAALDRYQPMTVVVTWKPGSAAIAAAEIDHH